MSLLFAAAPHLRNAVVVNQLSAKFLLVRRWTAFQMEVGTTIYILFYIQFVLVNYHFLDFFSRQRNFSEWWDGTSYLGLGKMPGIPLIPCNGKDHMVLNIYMRHLNTCISSLSEPKVMMLFNRLSILICPGKEFFTTAFPSQCLQQMFWIWVNEDRRRPRRSSFLCCFLIQKEPGKEKHKLHETYFQVCYRCTNLTVLLLIDNQAVAAVGQAPSHGHWRHCRQTTSDGGQETECAQVSAHGVWPGDDTPEPSEGKLNL